MENLGCIGLYLFLALADASNPSAELCNNIGWIPPLTPAEARADAADVEVDGVDDCPEDCRDAPGSAPKT